MGSLDAEFLKIAGPWALVLFFVVRETLPAFLSRQKAVELRSWNTTDRYRDQVIEVYEKFVAQQSENIRFTAQATAAMRDVADGLAEVRQAMQEICLLMHKGGAM